MTLRAWVVALALVLAGSAHAWALPDFSNSGIVVTPVPAREAELVTFSIVVRNSGTDDAESVYFSAEWPLMGFLVDATGFEDATRDYEARTLALAFPLAAGAERPFSVRVLAPRDSGGDALTVKLRVSHFASQTEWWDSATAIVETRTGASGIRIGGLRIAPAALVTLTLLAAGVVLWLVLRLAATRGRGRRSRSGRAASPTGPVAAVILASGFWALFGAMAWRDYQSLTSWPQSTCTILGGRLSEQTTTRAGSAAAPLAQRRQQSNFVPVLGVRYEVNGEETYSSGYDTGSRLGIGAQGGRLDELSGWRVGRTAPCWYNPDDPLDVVVVNGFGGAYLFALFPVPLFVIGVRGIRDLIAGR
jgi:hypothetical protein